MKGDNKNTFSLWCKKLKLPGVSMCILSQSKTEYGSSGIKVLMRHQLQDKHKAAICSLLHTSSLSDATTPTAKTRICVCDQTVCVCVLKAEHELSLTIQPLIELMNAAAEDQTSLTVNI